MNYLEERRNRVAGQWKSEGNLDSGVVLIEAGEPSPMPGTDQYHPFLGHPDFRYLADEHLPGATLAFDAGSGDWVLFGPRQDAEDRMWHGDVAEIGEPLASLESWLAGRGSAPTYRLGVAPDADQRLTSLVAETRLRKDADELERMRRAAAATVVGFEEVYRTAAPGMTERDIEAELEVGFRRGGGDAPAYDSIVAAARNAAVLHFEPTRTVVNPGDFVLIDAAAMVDGYACDCTRTFVVGGTPSQRHRDIHAIVTAAQEVAVSKCVPGAEYRQIHIETAVQMAEGLVELGILRGDPSDLVARGVAALFFPHGLGHQIGLSVHDVAGYAEGRERSSLFGLSNLRTDRPLQDGMVVTIEPGIYFIPAILEMSTDFPDDIDMGVAEDYIDIGGVRVEDCVHVSADGPENITIEVPKVFSI
ncbi:MAG: Xaa-Pro aminopeptidase [Verrucomicrobiales bacterium]